MSVDSFDTNLGPLTDAEMILKLHVFAGKIQDHPAFQNRPEHVPGPDYFLDAAGQLEALSSAAETGDRLKKSEKEALRALIIAKITFAAQHVVMVASHRNDPSMLNTIGLELRKKTYNRASSNLPPQPQTPTVKNGQIPGTVNVTVKKPRGVASVELQTTENPNDESSWTTHERYYTARMVAKGLASVKRHYFRCRFHNKNGSGPWSQVVELVVA